MSEKLTPKENQDAIFGELGRFIYHFASLETYLRITIIRAIEADEQTAMFLINRMDSRILITKLRGILKQRHILTDDTKWLLAACSEASDFRNSILHQAPVIYDDKPTLHLAPFGNNIQKGQKGAVLTAIPHDQLRLAADFCRSANADFACLNRELKRNQVPEIAGLTKAAFPQGFPKYTTADQANAHKPDQEALEAAHAIVRSLEEADED